MKNVSGSETDNGAEQLRLKDLLKVLYTVIVSIN